MRRPLVDITTFNAIESLFHRGQRDPWAKRLAGEFSDLVIYGDTIRYPINIPSADSPVNGSVAKPSILLALAKRDSDSFVPEEYATSETVLLKDEYLKDCFDHFSAWTKSNRGSLQRWMTLHKESWIQIQRSTRGHYVFSHEVLRKNPSFTALAKEVDIDEDNLCYAFDVILRYPLYGQFVGEDEYYLNHPIRNAFALPTMRREQGSSPQIAVSFKDSVSSLAEKLTLDEYTALLHELRGLVHSYALHKMKPGEFDNDVIREIAARVGLPPRLRAAGKFAAIGAGLIGGFGAVPAVGPAAAIAGAGVSISAALWTGQLPRTVARMKWLRWALEWDIEGQAEQRI